MFGRALLAKTLRTSLRHAKPEPAVTPALFYQHPTFRIRAAEFSQWNTIAVEWIFDSLSYDIECFDSLAEAKDPQPRVGVTEQ